VAIADMFLKLAGVTGEATDPSHTGEIEVISWSGGQEAPSTFGGTSPKGRAAMSELSVVKRVDQSTPTLMALLRHHKLASSATLTVRKAGTTPLPYLKLELTNVRVTSLLTDTSGPDLVDRLRLGFTKIRVTYTPQQSGTGAKGGGDVVFEAEAHAGA
jgi:type VI secretion system secreted protein Hcp